VDLQPIMLGADPGPYSSSGASGAVSVATPNDCGRKESQGATAYPSPPIALRTFPPYFAQVSITKFPVDLLPHFARVLTQILL
jgi:hypothetical protein